MKEKIKLNDLINKWYLFEQPISVSLSRGKKSLGESAGNLFMFRHHGGRGSSVRPYEVFLLGDKKNANFVTDKNYLDGLFLKQYKEVKVPVLDYEDIKRFNKKIGILHNFIVFSDEDDVSVFKNPYTYGNLANKIRSDSDFSENVSFNVYGSFQGNKYLSITSKLEKYRFNIQDVLREDNKLNDVITPEDYFNYLDNFNVDKGFGFGIKIFDIDGKKYFDFNMSKLDSLNDEEKYMVIRKELDALILSGIDAFKVMSLDGDGCLFKFSLNYFNREEMSRLFNSMDKNFKIHDFEILEHFVEKNDIENVSKILSIFSSEYSNRKTSFNEKLKDIVSDVKMVDIIFKAGFGDRTLLRYSKNKEVAYRALEYSGKLLINDVVAQFASGNGDVAIDLLKREGLMLNDLINSDFSAHNLFENLFNNENFSLRTFKKNFNDLMGLGVKSPGINLVVDMFKSGNETEFKFLLNNFKFYNEDYNDLFIDLTYRNYTKKKIHVVQNFLKIFSEINYVQDFKKLIISVNRGSGDSFFFNDDLFDSFMGKVDKAQDINDFAGLSHNMVLALAKNTHRSLLKNFITNYNPMLNVKSSGDDCIFDHESKNNVVRGLLHYLNSNATWDVGVDLFEDIIKRGVSVDFDGGGGNLLLRTVSSKNLEMANILLKYGDERNIFAVNADTGENIVHTLCNNLIFLDRHEYDEKDFVVNFFENIIKSNVDLEKMDNKGRKPLDILLSMDRSRERKLVDFTTSRLQLAILEKNIMEGGKIGKRLKI